MKVVDGKTTGIKPSGRIHERDEIAELKAGFEATIKQQGDVLTNIGNLVENDQSPLGQAINAELEPLKAGV